MTFNMKSINILLDIVDSKLDHELSMQKRISIISEYFQKIQQREKQTKQRVIPLTTILNDDSSELDY